MIKYQIAPYIPGHGKTFFVSAIEVREDAKQYTEEFFAFLSQSGRVLSSRFRTSFGEVDLPVGYFREDTLLEDGQWQALWLLEEMLRNEAPDLRRELFFSNSRLILEDLGESPFPQFKLRGLFVKEMNELLDVVSSRELRKALSEAVKLPTLERIDIAKDLPSKRSD